MVFAGLFPTDSDDYPELRDALERLKLNDAALFYEPETSQALGFGFRCGFLGLLHMEIVRERLEREFDLDLLVTAPNVAYRVADEGRRGDRGAQPRRDAERGRAGRGAVHQGVDRSSRRSTSAPVMELCNERRGRFDHMEYLSEERVVLLYELPLAEIVLDFYDQLKSRTRGYASFDYDLVGLPRGRARPRRHPRSRGEPVDALSLVIHRDGAYGRGRALVERLREEIPRQFFDVPIQAAIGSRVIARETVKAKRKDVLAKCYGGDITRKRKLLEKQKAGKKRMKQVGAVEVPQEAFLAVLNLDEEKRVSGASATSTSTCPFCAHRCGYCDFVTLVGRRGEHDAYVGRAARGARARARRCSRRSSRRSSSAAGRRRSPRRPRCGGCSRALPAADEVTVEANPETVTPELARLLREAGVNARLARRAELPAAAARGARAARDARTTSGARSTICVMPALTTSRSISSTGSPARAPPTSSATSRRRSRSRRSTSPATSSRRSRERASRTRTGRSSRARRRRWRATSSASSTA